MATADLPGRDRQGNWKPVERIEMIGATRWPPNLGAILQWLFGWPGFLWPWNALWFGIAAATWLWLTPPLATMVTLQPGWIALLLARNVALLVAYVSFFHVVLHTRRSQGVRYKYNDRWLSKHNRVFMFDDQTFDNAFWSIVSGGGLWTAYEVLTLWMYANGALPVLAFRDSPVAWVLMVPAIALFRHAHFYLAHRLLHWRPLYRAAHYIHHRNVNVGPWSGLSMHWIEHILYFSGVLIHWIVRSHLVHAIFHLQHAALSPAAAHCGFDATELGHEKAAVTHGSFYHYLHHRYFECNYAGDDAMILDKWLGSFHDGTPEAHTKMRARAHQRMRDRKDATA